eukprot:CAMPEP_0206543810 /NCGR_PEP_ID=MMETSP0325_2-20121206/11116_1 /ASSEMBLY_ACC=CAM_ASM_000347 /TAXON_ID=2866 /ORGANISM="Crypthecodinium cohnii, Strain Seligo" /LENGTH=837 /DNA_ID=CAMNT_0054042383 /DNA_START=232 /DNA_END=2745 /DNA_ORIENTATION=+
MFPLCCATEIVAYKGEDVQEDEIEHEAHPLTKSAVSGLEASSLGASDSQWEGSGTNESERPPSTANLVVCQRPPCSNCGSTYHEGSECPMPKGYAVANNNMTALGSNKHQVRQLASNYSSSQSQSQIGRVSSVGGDGQVSTLTSEDTPQDDMLCSEMSANSSTRSPRPTNPPGTKASGPGMRRPNARREGRNSDTRSSTSTDRDMFSSSSGNRLSSLPEPPTELQLEMAKPGIRIQVLRGTEWQDIDPEEFRHARNHIVAGEERFVIASLKAMYVMDWSDPAAPVQQDPGTGAVARMRVLTETGAVFGVSQDGGIVTTVKSNNKKKLRRMASDEYMPDEQVQYGAQSKRGQAPQLQMEVLNGNAHAQACFQEMEKREEHLCGDWAVFYHAYSFAALIYEVNAAVAAVLFCFKSELSTLPRILLGEFEGTPDAESLISRFRTEFAKQKRDHNPEYRKVAISTMCSLVALGPEASTPVAFLAGYSERDLSFMSVLENLLESCYVPKNTIKKLAADIVALSEKHGLDGSQYGGAPCKSGKAGHMLQIFIRRDLVDHLAYAAKPYGALDSKRHPLSDWLNGDSNMNFGQARIVANPMFFMQSNFVRMYTVSADPSFHHNRRLFQEELTSLLSVILGETSLRDKAARGIFGGELPKWWQPHDPRSGATTPSSKASSAPGVFGTFGRSAKKGVRSLASSFTGRSNERNSQDIAEWQLSNQDLIRKLTRPRVAKAILPEFATRAARDTWARNHPLKDGTGFDACLEASPALLAELSLQLPNLAGMLDSDFSVNPGGLSYDDITLFPMLRTLTLVKGLDWPDRLQNYVNNLAEISDVPLFGSMAC